MDGREGTEYDFCNAVGTRWDEMSIEQMGMEEVETFHTTRFLVVSCSMDVFVNVKGETYCFSISTSSPLLSFPPSISPSFSVIPRIPAPKAHSVVSHSIHS
jgi:hypothetical protein